MIDLTNLEWEEYAIDSTEQLQTRTDSPIGVDTTIPSFRPPRRGFCGPKIRHCEHLGAGQLFGTFFTVEIMTQFVNETNSFANRSYIRDWSKEEHCKAV
jgi:hypothetical protein